MLGVKKMNEREWFNKIRPNQRISKIIKNTDPTQLNTMLGEQLTSYLMKRIPLEITELPTKDEDYKLHNKQFVDSFCRKWIPRLYGVTSEYPQYRNACLCEFIRWYVVFGIPINYDTVRDHWYWEPDACGHIPDKLKIVAGFADILYSILWGLGFRIQYRIQTF